MDFRCLASRGREIAGYMAVWTGRYCGNAWSGIVAFVYGLESIRVSIRVSIREIKIELKYGLPILPPLSDGNASRVGDGLIVFVDRTILAAV